MGLIGYVPDKGIGIRFRAQRSHYRDTEKTPDSKEEVFGT